MQEFQCPTRGRTCPADFPKQLLKTHAHHYYLVMSPLGPMISMASLTTMSVLYMQVHRDFPLVLKWECALLNI